MAKTRSPLLPIFLIVLADVFGLTLVFPLLAIYAERLHASPFQATLLVSTYAACQLVSGPILGSLSDRYGRKPLLQVSQLGTLAGFIVMARADVLWMMFAARMLDGATAGNLSIAQAYISDNSKPEDRAKSFAVIGIAFGIGFFIGPFVTAELATISLAAPVWAAAGLSLTSILCTTFLLPGGPPPGAKAAGSAEEVGPGGRRLSIFHVGAFAPYFARPVLGGLLVQFLFFALSFSTFTSGFALFAERRFTSHGAPFTPREIGYLFAWAGFVGILLQGVLGRLVKRYGEARLAAVGFLGMGAGYLALGFVDRIGALVVVTTIASLGNALLRPSLSSLVSRQAGAHEQGAVLGLNQSLNSAAQIVAPAIGGILIERGWLTPWAAMAAVAAFAGLFAARWGSGRVVRKVATVSTAALRRRCRERERERAEGYSD